MSRFFLGLLWSLLGQIGMVVVAVLLATTTIRADIFTGGGFSFVDATKPGSNIVIGEASSNIFISGNGGSVAQINSISLVDLRHTWMGDIVIDLRHIEQNIRVIITAPPPNHSADFFGNYTFAVNLGRPTVDEAASGLGPIDVLIPATYEISGFGGGESNPGTRTSFSPFVNAPIDGNWQLRVRDFAVGETGSLGSWSFNASITAVPEPSSIALFFLALSLTILRQVSVIGVKRCFIHTILQMPWIFCRVSSCPRLGSEYRLHR